MLVFYYTFHKIQNSIASVVRIMCTIYNVAFFNIHHGFTANKKVSEEGVDDSEKNLRRLFRHIFGAGPTGPLSLKSIWHRRTDKSEEKKIEILKSRKSIQNFLYLLC